DLEGVVGRPGVDRRGGARLGRLDGVGAGAPAAVDGQAGHAAAGAARRDPEGGGRGPPGDPAEEGAEERGNGTGGRAAGGVAAVIDGEGGAAGAVDEHVAAYALDVAAQRRAVAADVDRVLATRVDDVEDADGGLHVHRVVAGAGVERR